MSTFNLAISCMTISNLIHGPNIPGFCAILLFTASDFTFTTRHIHNWASFLLWPSPLPGAISPLLPSTILDTFWLRGFIFQCHIFLFFHTVYGVLEATTLKWFAIPFSNGPHFCHNSPPWPIRVGWPCTAWLIASLSYTSPFSMTRLWCMNGLCTLSFLK